MLDKRSSKLLRSLANICEDGSFKVIEITEMAKSISRNTAAESIRPILKYMQDNDMIDVKYADEAKYCLSVLPKGRVYVEDQIKKVDIALSRRMLVAVITGGFVAAFVGALLANIIFKLIGS
jgi:hypothetical protein